MSIVEKLAYTIPEAARATALSRSTIYREIKDGRLSVVTIRGRTLITAPELRRYIGIAP